MTKGSLCSSKVAGCAIGSTRPNEPPEENGANEQTQRAVGQQRSLPNSPVASAAGYMHYPAGCPRSLRSPGSPGSRHRRLFSPLASTSVAMILEA